MLINREHFTHEKMTEKLLTIVDNLVSSVPQEVSLRLPKLVKKNNVEVKKSDVKIPKLKKV